MMRRRELLRGAILLAALGAAPPLLADPVAEITRQLRADGFEVREIGRTWLRRVRIVAESPTERREVVFDPVTGEIRRDYVTDRLADRQGSDGNREDRSGNGGGGGGGGEGGGNGGRDRDDDDDDDDRGGPDDDDDDDDDDHSGPGGGDHDDDDDDDDD